MNPDEQELVQALAAADAAGDTGAATKIAAAIRTMRERARLQTDQIGEMSGFDKIATGVGRGFNDVGQGVKQLGLRVMDAMTPGFNPGRADDYTKKVGEELALYEPLKQDSPWLTGGGRLVGNIAAMPIPAGRGATLLGRAGTSALAGGAQGAVQFVPEGGSRALNTAFGATIGALIPGLIEGGKVTVGAVRTLAGKLKELNPLATQAQVDRLAKAALDKAIHDPASLAKLAQPSALVPGTTQTLAEVTDDVGISGLQQVMRNMDDKFNNRLFSQAQRNNNARVGAVQGAFSGADEAGAVAIEQARDKATNSLLAAARKVKGVDTKPVLKMADAILEARKGNPTVSGAVAKVREILAGDGMDNVRNLHNARQEIGYILAGQSETKGGPAVSRELLQLRRVLDAKIAEASPEFKQFLSQYAAMSRDAGQVRMGAELLTKSAASLDALGNPVLSPAKWAGARRNLDEVARQATGFRKETADRLMTPAQRQVTDAIGTDLDRYARSLTQGAPPNSATARNIFGAARIQDAVTGGAEAQGAMLPGLSMALNIANKFKAARGERVMQALQEVMADPRSQQSMRILAALPKAQRSQVRMALQDSRLMQALQAIQVAGPSSAAAAVVGGPEQQ